MQLLERAEALAMLDAALGSARAGNGTVVLVSGEAGIGKTALIRAFTAAVPADVRVLTGLCDDLAAPRALGALRDAVAGSGGALERALATGDLDAVLPAAVDEFTGPEPTVFVGEDLHWADDATLDVIAHLTRRIEAAPTVLVLTYRDDEISTVHPLRRLLGIVASASPTRIRLQPLTTAAVAVLAAPSGRNPAAIHSITGGNPFYVTEAIAAPADAVSATVAATVLARVRSLSPLCRQALQQLSVVPGTIDHDLAEALLGPALDSLTEAEDRQIIETRSTGIGFRHELTRQALEQSLPAITRRSANRAVTRALLAAGTVDLANVVHHAAAAGDAATVVAYAPTAGREAARTGAHRQALKHFEVALATGLLERAERAALLAEYAWELHNAHRLADAADASRQAAELLRAVGDLEAAGLATVGLAHHLTMAGNADDGLAAITEAVAILDEVGSTDSRAYAATMHGAIATTSRGLADAAPLLAAALTLAEEVHRPDLAGLCRIYLAVARKDPTDDERITLLWTAIGETIAAGAHESAGRGYSILGEQLYRFGRWDELEECIAQGAPYTIDHDLPVHSMRLELLRCQLLIRRGFWEAAEGGLAAVVADAGVSMFAMLARANLERLRLRTGTTDAVVDVWEQAVAGGWLIAMGYAALGLVERAWLTGDTSSIDAVLRTAPSELAHPVAVGMHAELARYIGRAGLPVEVFPGCPEPWASGIRGDWRAAAAGWAEIGDPYERALELAESGSAEQTFEALRLLDTLGAGPAATIVRQRLRNLGVRRVPRGPTAATRAHPAGLTARQVDVLGLLSDGLTNTEIAERLFLSVRTVDHHVSAVLAKLGVTSRREAALLLTHPAGSAGDHPRLRARGGE